MGRFIIMQDQQPITEEEFWAALNAMPEPATIFYRLYYDEHGQVLFYSMEDVPGNYIEITQQQYADSNPLVRVVDGKIVPIKRYSSGKLVPSDTGTPCCPDNVAIVVDASVPHQCWSQRVYEQS